MELHSHFGPHHHRVTALFGDHQQSFDLLAGTTFAQLAEQLAGLAQDNQGWPKGISIVFERSSQPLPARQTKRRRPASSLVASQ
ncbi:MAG: hypothetical protein NW217_16470 [Hyphomicrobiaceae bacterium]|nr:hypothetical protein [Hyphomicrobiaceae bacterium]